MKRNKNGIFVVSLDFELMWGMLDCASIEGYGNSNVRQVHKVFDSLLPLFEKYNVKATIGTVGLLMCADKAEALNSFPAELPQYSNPAMSAFTDGFIASIADENKSLFFAKDIVEKLKASPNIEIGTHTFGHYYCWDDKQTLSQFRTDMDQAVAKAAENDIQLQSIIFPRNNVSPQYLEIARQSGITFYRGNPHHLYGNCKSAISSLIQRAARLLDCYLPLTRNTYDVSETVCPNGMRNVKASRFMRPYSGKLKLLEGLKVRRIKKELISAARNGQVYHLWWHPHNFGANMEENLQQLEEILSTFKRCAESYGMRSLTFSEFKTANV